jgi:outer membrane protein insertion porin family
MINKLIKIAVVILAFSFQAKAQFSITSDKVSYETPKDYEIGGITVEGVVNYDSERIISLSGLRRGEKITVPGDDITQAIRRLWDQKLFSDIKIFKIKITDETIFLKIQLKERKRL